MKKIWVFITTLLLSFSLMIPCYAQETDDLGFTSVEEYDYYREKIPDYVETFSKEFAEWYVNEGLPGPLEDDTPGPVNCNCVEENNYDNDESYNDDDESYDYYEEDNNDESYDYYEDDELYGYENNSYDDDELNSNNITNVNKTETQKQNKKDLKENLKDSKNPYGEIQPDISRDDLPLFIRIPLQIWEKINEFTKWVFSRN